MRILEELLKEGRNAEVEEERTKVTAGGSITRQAEVELRVTDVDVRRGTEDTPVAVSGFTRKARAVAQSAGTEGNLHSVEGSDCLES